jgi:hypothetical protein
LKSKLYFRRSAANQEGGRMKREAIKDPIEKKLSDERNAWAAENGRFIPDQRPEEGRSGSDVVIVRRTPGK